MRADVVVIGSGASGAGAALAATRAGARVVVVRRGYGATALASGAVRLDLPEWLPGRTAGPDAIEPLLGEVLSLVPLGGRKRLLTALGTTVEADMAFATMAAGCLDRLAGKRLAVVGLAGLSEVRATPVARGAAAEGLAAEVVTIRFPEAKHGHDLTTPELARLADDAEVARALADRLAEATAGFDAVALPPVAGLRRWREVRAVLDAALGEGRWFELVAALPSVAGMRMQAEIDRALHEAGARVVHGRVHEVAVDDGLVVGLRAGEGAGAVVVEPLEVVLATGGLVGRGLRVHDTEISEAILELALDPSGSRPGGDEAELAPGVRVDDEMRPVDGAGSRRLDNVRVAGELAGLSFGAGAGGIAVAMATGWAAGRLASASAGRRKARDIAAASWEGVAADGDPLGCVSCGFCLAVCPTVRALSREKTTYPGPRGMMAGLTRWETELEGVSDELSLCTLCGACAAVCTAAVPVPEAIVRCRGILARTAPGAGPPAYAALRGAFEKPGRLFDCEPMAGPRLERAETVLFVGCSLPYYERDNATATMRLLDALGLEYTLIDEVCCGGPLEVIGGGEVEGLAAHNVAELRRVGARRVVTCCPRCAATMEESPAYADLEIEHTTGLLARLLPGSEVGRLLRDKLGGQAVTFHDPCERARLAGEIEHARAAMAAVGLELREMPRSGTFTDCCGAGGGVRAAQTKTSLRIARLRVADAVETGAPVLLTECPSCLHNLFNGRKRSQKIAIDNLSSFLGSQL